MDFGITLIRSFFLAFGVLAAFFGSVMLLSFPGTRTRDIQRRDLLKHCWRMVEKQRAKTGSLPESISVETTIGSGDVHVRQWQSVNWRHPRDFGGGARPDPSAKDYILSYSNASSDWMDILDSKTGRTSLDNTGIHDYLLSPVLTLALAGGLFYVARCLRQDPPRL